MPKITSYSYNGFIVNSTPHQAHDGGYIVNGHIIDDNDSYCDVIPISGSKVYQTRDEADQAFFTYAKSCIDQSFKP